MEKLTQAQVELCRGKNFAAVATVNEDGTPQTSIVWIDTDGENVVFNTTNGRAKGRHLRRDPRVSVSVFDAQDPYRYFEVEGVAELQTGGALDHIHALSQRYRGTDYVGDYDRVIVTVKAQRIFDYQVS
ncbi:MAG TPA: PPOX class F420-dependent oxidoreductase [Gaiellaceae bacterium]